MQKTSNKMKTLIFALLLAGTCMAQPKGANVLVIKTDLNTVENFKLCGKTLLAAGYAFNMVDDVFYTLTTQPKQCSKTNTTYTLQISCAENAIKIRGKFGMRMRGFDDESKIKNKGMAGSPQMVAFGDMLNAAKLFSLPLEFIIE